MAAPVLTVVVALVAYGAANDPTGVDVETVPPAARETIAPDATAGSAGGGGDGPGAPAPGRAPRKNLSTAPQVSNRPGLAPGDAAELVTVFASDRTGVYQVYWAPFGGGTPRQVTRDLGAATRPALSPDGREVAFVHQDGATTRIRVAPIDGSTFRTLPFDGAAAPSWSPDGRLLAFAYERGIWVADPNGGSARRLTGTSRTPLDTDPAWSPDGSQIAFFRFHTDNTGELMAMRIDGSDVRRVVPGVAVAPAWSPDGSRIAFVDLSSRPGRIALVRPDGSGLVRLTGTDAWAGRPSWTPDGSALVYDRDPDGHTPPSCRVGAYGGRVVNSCIPTSDGPAKAELWAIGADGSGARRLVASGSNDIDVHVGRQE